MSLQSINFYHFLNPIKTELKLLQMNFFFYPFKPKEEEINLIRPNPSF